MDSTMIKYLILLIIFLFQCLPALAGQQQFMGQTARKNVATTAAGFVGNDQSTTATYTLATDATYQTAYQVFTPLTSGPIGYCHVLFTSYDSGLDNTNIGILSSDGTTLLVDSTTVAVDDNAITHFQLDSEYTVSTETPVMIAISRAGYGNIGHADCCATNYTRNANINVSDPFASPISGGTATGYDLMIYCDNTPTGSL
jgi:hypothetical protein